MKCVKPRGTFSFAFNLSSAARTEAPLERSAAKADAACTAPPPSFLSGSAASVCGAPLAQAGQPRRKRKRRAARSIAKEPAAIIQNTLGGEGGGEPF